MTTKAKATSEPRYASPSDRAGQTDDERIKDITVLPPPEHLMRFFPMTKRTSFFSFYFAFSVLGGREASA